MVGATVKRGERGSALVLSFVIVVVLAAAAAALVSLTVVESQARSASLEGEQAVEDADAAVALKLLELNDADDATARTYEGAGRVSTIALEKRGAMLLGKARGEIGRESRDVEVVFGRRFALPFPGAGGGGALAIYGDPDKAKLKIAGVDKDLGDDGSAGVVVSDGHDAAGLRPGIPGLAVEGDAFDRIMSGLAKKMLDEKKAKIPGTVFDGEPVVDVNVYDKKGKYEGTITTSAVEVDGGQLDYPRVESLADSIIASLRSNVMPGATVIDTGSKGIDIKGGLTIWGTPFAPRVTVVTGKDLRVDGGAVVRGSGILVVTGNLNLHHATLEFDGPVIVFGDKDKKSDDPKLHLHHGTMTINGPLLLLGDDSSKTAKLHLHNDDKTNDGLATINGPVLAIAQGDKKTKAELKAHHGDVEINGVVMLAGDRAKLDVGKDKRDTFRVDGGVVVAVPPHTKDKTKADIRLDNGTAIRYDSVEVERSIRALNGLAGQIGAPEDLFTEGYRVMSWREPGRAR